MNKNEILIISDHGDREVGLFPQSWEIQCPFYENETDIETKNWFKNEMITIYMEFCNGRCSAYYSSEKDLY